MRRSPIRNRPKPNSSTPPITNAPIPALSLDTMLNLTHELLHDVVFTVLEFHRCSLRDDVSFIQNDQLVADSSGARDVMRHDDDRGFVRRFEIDQKLVDFTRCNRI